MVEQIGAFAGLAAFLGLAVLALLSFAQGRDIRRLREWAGSAPERDTERKEATSATAAARAEELRQLEQSRTTEREVVGRDERRQRREDGLPSGSRFADPRYLIAAFVVFLVAAGAVAFFALGGSDDDGGKGKGKGAKAAVVKPSEIEVTVLNGTASSGLAATFGDKVERKGFALGQIGNTTQSFDESAVMFDRGHKPEADRVAKQLQIADVELISAEVEGLSGGAPVAVIVGEDNAETAG